MTSILAIFLQTLLYPSGCGIALHSHKSRKQELVALADKGKHLTAIGMSKSIAIVIIPFWLVTW